MNFTKFTLFLALVVGQVASSPMGGWLNWGAIFGKNTDMTDEQILKKIFGILDGCEDNDKVKCNDHKRVTYLDLSSKNWKTLPAAIGELTNLKGLHLSNNKLKQFPTEILNLKQLKELFLHDNKLTKLPAEIGELAQLDYLSLFNNKLIKLPAEIGSLKELRKSSLFGNPWNQTTSDEIRNLVVKTCNIYF